MNMPMQRLRVSGFRGATKTLEVIFDGKPVVMIFGENGTGKSTIVDAIDFAFNELPGPLAERQVTPVGKFLPALGCKATDLKVEMEWSGNKWTGKLSGAKPTVTGPASRPRAIILRKTQILTIIDAQPAKRYEAFSRFIAVPKVEQAENSLREAANEAQSEFNDATKALAEALDTLKKLWEADGSPDGDCLTWAKKRAASNPKSLDANSQHLSALFSHLQSATDAFSKVETSRKQDANNQALLDKANSELKVAQAANAAAENALLKLLESAEAYLKSRTQLQECPVCEQKIEVATVLERLAFRKAAGAAVIEADRKVSAAVKAKETSHSHLKSDLASFRSAVAKLAQAFKSSQSSTLVNQQIPWKDFDLLFGSVPENRIDEASAQAERLLALCENTRQGLQNERQIIDSALQNLKAITLQVGRVAQHTVQAKGKQKLAGRLQDVLTIVESQRKQFVERALRAVTTRADTLYSQLHPNEGLGDIKFQLNPNRPGSLNMSSTFQSACDVPPQAYYSEAHLDTLGVCIFIALAEGYANQNTLLVLDDVLTSADQAHVDRFIEIVHDVCGKVPVLITTHYRPWRDRYRYARGPTANVQLIELLPWSQACGVRHTKTKLEAEELKDVLAKEPVDRQAVASKSGVLLEATLEYLCALYQGRLPHKPGGSHTLGEYLSGIDSKLRKLLKSIAITGTGGSGQPSETAVVIQPLLERIEAMAWIRNVVGAHFSLPGMEVSNAEVLALGTYSVELVDALVCPKCGALPWKNTGSFYSCGCGARQLHPLTVPGAPTTQAGN